MVQLRIEDIVSYAHENHVPIMLEDGIRFLTSYIEEHHYRDILEIGTAIGYSAIKMALVDPCIHVTTIERDLDSYKRALANIQGMKLDSQITVIYGDALDVDLKDTYDLIFIDAAKSQYTRFFQKFEKNLREDGAIVSDNLSFHGLVEHPERTNNRNTKQLLRKIRAYRTFLTENTMYHTTFYQVGDGISVSKKNKKEEANT